MLARLLSGGVLVALLTSSLFGQGPAVTAVPQRSGKPEPTLWVASPEGRALSAAAPIWARADYLLWWTSGMGSPPLATTGPQVPQNQAGVLGQPGTNILFGGELLDSDRSGGRFTLGIWLDDLCRRGLDVSYLALGTQTSAWSASQREFAVLARPFFNTQISMQDARRIAFPGEINGTLDIGASTDFRMLDAVYRSAIDGPPHGRAEFLLGYRFAQLEDQLRVDESTIAVGGAAPGAMIDLYDQFETVNEFHGAELGIRWECPAGDCFSWELLAKVAIGNTNSRARIAGVTTTTVGGQTTTASGGLLTQPTNIGTFEQDEFSAIWELGVNLNRQLPCGLTARLGYSVLLWQDVSRAGEQIDFAVNPSQIPPGTLMGEPRPGFAFNTTDFWAHGLNVGLEYTY